MPNKTIYVAEKDLPLFEEAQELGGEALSSVIVQSLRDYIGRMRVKADAMQEISLDVGMPGYERVQRFIGTSLGQWSGLSNDGVYWMRAEIYRTQKGSLAIYVTNVGKASLLMHGAKDWREWADHSTSSELLVISHAEAMPEALPQQLQQYISTIVRKEDAPVEYLDI